jgi:GTP pyrophosphokinase
MICGTQEECYVLLGMVHSLFTPVDGRFKDYIASPKPNGYMSLHTTVKVDVESTLEEQTVEIQIRTRGMHEKAEYGYASHWLYKAGTQASLRAGDAELSTINSMGTALEHELENQDVHFFDELKSKVLKNSIFVFTPQYKVVELPAGSTPVDFAYQIHTSIGEHCAMAKVSNKIVPLSKPLENGAVVDILTSIAARPHINWLSFVKTQKARSKIRGYYNGEKNIESSKERGKKGKKKFK